MIGDSAQIEIFKQDYRRHRKLAKKHRDREEYDDAARHYHKSADLLEEIADLESSDRVTRKRREKAQKLREVGDTLDRVAAGEAEFKSEVDQKEVDDPDRARQRTDDEGVDAEQYLEDPPDVDFGDVGGMDDLEQTLRDKVLDPLERPELYERYDLGVVNGVLLYGPPGTGKTYITKALAGEIGYQFIDVEATDVVSSLVGEAADNVAEIFEVAMDNQPCLVFLDEIDALAPERSGGSQKTQSERQMITQLLTKLSEIRDEDVIVVAATNIPEEIDSAAWSRFQERIEVPPPDPPARESILRIHLRERPVLHDHLDWGRIRDLTEEYTARDLKLVANNAARAALKEARESEDIEYITQDHVERAIAETEPSLADFEGYDLAE